MERIVSLLPAATEWVAALGAGDALVGRSHACDYPTFVRDLPVVTRPAIATGGDAAAIGVAVRSRLQQGLSVFEIDLEHVRDLRPDLVLTQAQCDVCAVSLPQLQKAQAGWTGTQPVLFSLAPLTFKQVLETALRLGRLIGRPEDAMRFVGDEERRLHLLRERMGFRERGDRGLGPSVACVEWLQPLMVAGHWMPDVAELAGGRSVLAERGTPSRTVLWEDLIRVDPDVLAIMPCGFTLEETARDLHFLTDRSGWLELRAVREGRVFLFDGNAYFNRPGPRLYRAVELLAAALSPGRLPEEDLDVQPWEMRMHQTR